MTRLDDPEPPAEEIGAFIGAGRASLAPNMRLLIPVGTAQSGARASGLQVTSFPAQGTNGI
ncbi:MAG: hypothetical protein WB679_11585, partial [Terracidiphilus sp.]